MAVFNKAVMVKESTTDVFDLMVEAVHIDHSLFESLIEVDFAEAYNEAGIIALNEEEQAAAGEAQKKGIFSKIGEIIKNAAKAIETIFKNIINFIMNLVSNDKKIWEKYGKVMRDRSNVSKCPVKGKYVDAEYYKGIKEKVMKAFDTMADENVQVTDDSIGDVEYSRDNLIKDSGDKTIIEAMSNTDYDILIKFVNTGYKAEIDTVKEGRKKALERLKKVELEYKNASKKSTDETADDSHNNYKLVLTQSSKIRKLSSKLCAAVNAAIATDRAAFLKIAAWATKHPSDNIINKTAAEQNKQPDNFDSDVSEAAVLEAYDMLIDLENEAFINRITGV